MNEQGIELADLREGKQADDKRASLSPGDVISVDQLETSTPGFIGQITAPFDNRKHRNVGVVRSSTGITQYLTACQAIDTECTTLAYPATICIMYSLERNIIMQFLLLFFFN